MRRIDLTNYTVSVRNEEEQYAMKDGRTFSSIQECLKDLGVELPDCHRWSDLPQEYQDQIAPVEWVDMPYEVKESLVEILFCKDLDGMHPELRISGIELLVRDDLARKVRDSDGVLLLEEVEWGKFKTSAEFMTGFGKPDVELIRRILKAEKVEVEEKPAEPAETEEKP